MSKIEGTENAQELPFSIMVLCSVGTVVRIRYANHVYLHRITTAGELIEFLGRVNSTSEKVLVVTEITPFSNDDFKGLDLWCK